MAEPRRVAAWRMHRIPFAATIDRFPGLLEPGSGVIKAVVEMQA